MRLLRFGWRWGLLGRGSGRSFFPGAGYRPAGDLRFARSQQPTAETNSQYKHPIHPNHGGRAKQRPVRFPSPSVCAEERRVSRIRARSCLSEASSARPRETRAPQVARSEAEGRRQWGRLSFAYVSLAKQRKVGRPPGRDPASELKKTKESRPQPMHTKQPLRIRPNRQRPKPRLHSQRPQSIHSELMRVLGMNSLPFLKPKPLTVQ